MKNNYLNIKKILLIATCIILPLSTFSLVKAATNNKSATEEKDNKLKIYSDEAKYDRKNKVAVAKGHVKMVQDNVTIYSSSATYNEAIKTSFIENFVRIIQLDKETKRKTDISSNKMIVYHSEKKVHLENEVIFDREEERKENTTNPNLAKRDKAENAIRKERTVITSDEVDYWTKSGDAIFKGDVVVVQKEKKARGEIVTVKNDANKNTDTITLDQNAKVTQIRGDWLVKEKILEPEEVKEDTEKERLVKERLDMEADKIVIYQKTSDIVGIGNVIITQKVANKNRQATGEKAVYNDKNQTMTLTGNVKIKRENEDWLTATKAVFHTDSENFEAYSTVDPNTKTDEKKKQVETEFIIPDEDKPEPESPVGTPEPQFNLDSEKKKNLSNNKGLEKIIDEGGKAKNKPVPTPSPSPQKTDETGRKVDEFVFPEN